MVESVQNVMLSNLQLSDVSTFFDSRADKTAPQSSNLGTETTFKGATRF